VSEVTRQLPNGGSEVFRGFDAEGQPADPPEAVGALIARYNAAGGLISERVFRVETATELGEWVEGQHPRGKGGKFAKKPRMGYFGPEIDGMTVSMPDSAAGLGGWKKGEWKPPTGGSSVVGITPYRDRRNLGKGFFKTRRTRAFKKDLKKIAASHDVKVIRDDPAQGVWVDRDTNKPGGEPSFSIELQDSEAGVRKTVRELGGMYGQQGAVTFRRGRGVGAMATYHGFTEGDRPELNRLITEHGLEGATIREGNLEIMGEGPGFVDSLVDIGNQLGMSYSLDRGNFGLELDLQGAAHGD
jgi:hypothetical protein